MGEWVCKATPHSACNLQRQVACAHALARRCEAGLPPNPLAARLRDEVGGWKAALPAVAALRNGDLRERHWAAIGNELGAAMDKREDMALADVLNLRVGRSARARCPACR